MTDMYIVRADFFPNGSIVPLGITDQHGNTIYIDRIIKCEVPINFPAAYKFICYAQGKTFSLVFKDNKWDYAD